MTRVPGPCVITGNPAGVLSPEMHKEKLQKCYKKMENTQRKMLKFIYVYIHVKMGFKIMLHRVTEKGEKQNNNSNTHAHTHSHIRVYVCGMLKVLKGCGL